MKRKILLSLALLMFALGLIWARPVTKLVNAEPAAARTAVAPKAAIPLAPAPAQKDRCATKQIDESIAVQYEASLNNFNAQRNPGQIRKSGAVTIGVFFHVVNKGPGIENGDVPLKWLKDQIRVLNAPTPALTPQLFPVPPTRRFGSR